MLAILLVSGCGGDGGSLEPTPVPSYTIGGALTGLRSPGVGLVLKLSNGDLAKVLYDGAFTFGTPIKQGDSYQVTVEVQPTGPDQTCTVTNGSGTVAGGNVVSVAVNCTTPSATNILVLNGTGVDRADGFIRGFLLNPTSGALTPKSVEAAPGGAGSLAYYAPKQQLYVSRWNVGNANYVDWGLLYQYSFDIYGVPKGQLTTGGGGQIAVNPVNGYLYGLTRGNLSIRPPARVPSYHPGTIYPLTGPNAARDLQAAPSFGRGLRRMIFDANGLMFVTADGEGQDDQARILSISVADPDAPTLRASYSANFVPFAAAANANGRFLYVTAPDQTFGYVFHYDGNGALTPLSSGTFSALADARSVLLSPDGSRLYLASSATGAVQCYAIGADGIPVAKGASVIAGADPVGMTFDPDGKYLYVLNRGDDATADSSTISGYSVAENCSLTTIPGMPISAGSMGTAIGVARFTP